MLTTIQELEQEIDQFHKNIKDSNGLMKILKALANLTKTQTEVFEVHSKALEEHLSRLPPELSDLFQSELELFIQKIHSEYQSYQTSVTKLMDGYAERFSKAESALKKIPSALEARIQKDRIENVAELKHVQELYTADLAKTNEAFANQLQGVVERIQTLPDQIKEVSAQQFDMFLKEHEKLMNAQLTQLSDTKNCVMALSQQLDLKYNDFLVSLKQVQELYTADLAKTNEVFANQLQGMVGSIQALPDQIKEVSAQQYDIFLNKYEKMMNTQLIQLSDTEKRVMALSQQLDLKYNDFVAKLETTNMDQLYKYCQDMNKSIKTKLDIALGGVAVAVIVSIISLII